MTARLRLRDSSSTIRTITRLRMRDAGGTLRTISRARMRGPDNVLRIVYDPSGASSLAGSASPSSVAGTSATTTVTSASTTVTATGGTAPYTYAWTVIAYDNATSPTVTSAAAATTTFQQTNVGAGEVYYATFRCTITDNVGNTAKVDVTGSFLSPGGGGGGSGSGGGSGHGWNTSIP
jgi:hypothetical protein